MSGFSLTKRERLHLNSEFKNVFKKGKVCHHPLLTMFVYNRITGNHSDIARLGLVVSRKIGNAVKRNRVKRILREFFRLNKNRLIPGVDIVFIPKNNLTQLNFNQIKKIVSSLWHRAKIIC